MNKSYVPGLESNLQYNNANPGVAATEAATILSQPANDYDSPSFVEKFHQINEQDQANISTTHILQNIIVNNFPDDKKINWAELGGGSHIGNNHYTTLFDKATHVDWVDLSQQMLDKAQEVLDADPEKNAKVSLLHQSFNEYLQTKEDNSLDAVNMKYCINYLNPEEIILFMKLLHQKLQKGGILTANYGMRKGVLPARIPTAKFLHNGKEMTEPVQLQDGDTYTIIFIDGNGQQINKGTTKYFYSREYLLNLAHSFETYAGSSNKYLGSDSEGEVGVLVLKKK